MRLVKLTIHLIAVALWMYMIVDVSFMPLTLWIGNVLAAVYLYVFTTVAFTGIVAWLVKRMPDD